MRDVLDRHMGQRILRATVIGGLVVGATACQASGDPATSPTTRPTPTASRTTDPETPTRKDELLATFGVKRLNATEPVFPIVTTSLAELVATSDAVVVAVVQDVRLGPSGVDSPKIKPIINSKCFSS